MIRTRIFGRLEGRDVVEAVLQSGETSVAILNYGCVLRDWRLPVAGVRLPMVLGFEEFEPYYRDTKAFGIIAGRVANRISRGRFTLDGVNYQLPINDTRHTLHGGMRGLGRRLWTLDPDSARNSVRLSYDSPDGEEGFPGNIRFETVFSLHETALTIEMRGVPDRPTPINLAQHSYYNLNGGGDIRNHVVQVAASRFTPLDAELIPTGEIAAMDGQVFDFRAPVSVAENDPAGAGIDINTILDENRDMAEPAAIVRSPDSGVQLRLWTREPGLQLYNAPAMKAADPGLDGAQYGPFAGLCLEAQHFADAVNQPRFPSITRTPETPYYQRLVVDIST